jgi:hypothetical protein
VSITTGSLLNGDLLFVGDDYPKPGVVENNRVLFRRLPKGSLEEYWTVSTDHGKTWKVAFDGFFRPL